MKTLFTRISILAIMIFIFFGYLFSNIYIGLIILISISLPSILLFKTIRFDKQDLFLLLFILVSTLSIFYSIDFAYSLGYVFGLICIFYLNIYIRRISNYKEDIVKYLTIFSFIHLLFTFLYLIIPDIILELNRTILNTKAFNDIYGLYSVGAISGIAGQTGTNAIYLSVFTSIYYSKILTKKDSIVNILLLLLGLLGLFLTQKRALLLANIIAMFITYLINYKGKIKINYKKIALLLFSMSLLFYIINSPIFQEAFSLLTEKGGNDGLSGRLLFWDITLDVFYESPLIGSGINSIHSIIDVGTHNVYIQLLAEVGIIGIILYLIFIFANLLNTFKVHKTNTSLFTNISFYSQIVFLIYSFSGNPIYNFRFLLLYILMVSLSYRLEKTYESNYVYSI